MKLTNNDNGFTLLEIMISMLILAIAFLALIAVQLGALNGYISARDNTEATALAEGTAELLRVHALSWETGTLGSGDAVYTNTALPFKDASPHSLIEASSPSWVPMTDEPLDVRYNRPELDTDHLGGKFCVFVRGQQLGTNDAAWQYQIAVAYPGPNASLLDCTDFNDNFDLNDGGSPGVPPAFEEAGYRAVYYGTLVMRRTWAGQDSDG